MLHQRVIGRQLANALKEEDLFQEFRRDATSLPRCQQVTHSAEVTLELRNMRAASAWPYSGADDNVVTAADALLGDLERLVRFLAFPRPCSGRPLVLLWLSGVEGVEELLPQPTPTEETGLDARLAAQAATSAARTLARALELAGGMFSSLPDISTSSK